MSGDRYGQVTFFTFLTLPGVIGIASYSGSLTVIFAFVMCVFLLGHGIETFTARITGNPAAAAVCGVSLAYLTAQMGYPWDNCCLRRRDFYRRHNVGPLMDFAKPDIENAKLKLG